MSDMRSDTCATVRVRSHLVQLTMVTATELTQFLIVTEVRCAVLLTTADNVERFVNRGSLYVLLGLTFNISTFCPHSVLTCFVWI